MKYTVRQETKEDEVKVFQVIEAAFKDEEYSDHQEQFLVNRLRKTDAFIPELSLVAEYNSQIIGQILLTRVHIKNKNHQEECLALAPVSVVPEYHKKGIGSTLIQTAHRVAKSLGFKAIVLLGHEAYYPKFGYKPSHTFGITFPFPAPDENCMVLELYNNSLDGISGEVVYPPAFFEKTNSLSN